MKNCHHSLFTGDSTGDTTGDTVNLDFIYIYKDLYIYVTTVTTKNIYSYAKGKITNFGVKKGYFVYIYLLS